MLVIEEIKTEARAMRTNLACVKFYLSLLSHVITTEAPNITWQRQDYGMLLTIKKDLLVIRILSLII
jgi:hypothetical protein